MRKIAEMITRSTDITNSLVAIGKRIHPIIDGEYLMRSSDTEEFDNEDDDIAMISRKFRNF